MAALSFPACPLGHHRGAGADVTLIERTRDGGRKILISGGGRCNVLPAVLDGTGESLI
jgi:predicted flavoprotein YhiN